MIGSAQLFLHCLSFADVASILTLNVIDCGLPLSTNIISFSGKPEGDKTRLSWVVSRETEHIQYAVEQSVDGRNFSTVAIIEGHNNNSEINYYSHEEFFRDEAVYYRIKLIGQTTQKLSRIIKIGNAKDQPGFVTVVNPFNNQLIAEFNSPVQQNIHLQMIDNAGKVVRSQSFNLMQGVNVLRLENLGLLPKGLYTLRLSTNDQVFSKTILKQ